MATRLGRLLNTTPESWLMMQNSLDLWLVAQDAERLNAVTPIKEVA
jgi:plasmid maintenance system antidote protein VapI